MRTSWDLTAIHTAITWAAADPSRWTPALERIATASGAVGAALLPIKISDRPLGLTGTAGATPVITKQGATFTYTFNALPVADWNNGLILNSIYKGNGQPKNTLTAKVTNTTAGESGTAPPVSIAVTDPPALASAEGSTNLGALKAEFDAGTGFSRSTSDATGNLGNGVLTRARDAIPDIAALTERFMSAPFVSGGAPAAVSRFTNNGGRTKSVFGLPSIKGCRHGLKARVLRRRRPISRHRPVGRPPQARLCPRRDRLDRPPPAIHHSFIGAPLSRLALRAKSMGRTTTSHKLPLRPIFLPSFPIANTDRSSSRARQQRGASRRATAITLIIGFHHLLLRSVLCHSASPATLFRTRI
jgi:hypothetical protein